MTAHAETWFWSRELSWTRSGAENWRLRREAGDHEVLERIQSDSGEGRTSTPEELGEAWGISE